MNWCSYDAATGRIINVGSTVPTSTLADFAHFEDPVLIGVGESVKWDTHYVVEESGNWQVLPRVNMSIIVAGMVLKGVQDGSKVEIEGIEYDADGSDIELEFTHPGTYTVKVRKWPFYDWSAEIENQA